MTIAAREVETTLLISEIFSEVLDKPLYRWQLDYIEECVDRRSPSPLINLPTASGKSTAVVIHVLCACLDVFERDTRRVWCLLPTRSLVDAASSSIRGMLARLADSQHPAAVELRKRIKDRSGHEDIQFVSYYGGSASVDREIPSPERLAVIVTTHDQAMQILFSNRRSRWAALSIGSSIVLDEAHTNPNVERVIANHFRIDKPGPLESYLTSMSATVEASKDQFVRARADLAADPNVELSRRMMAFATVTLDEVPYLESETREVNNANLAAAARVHMSNVFDPSIGHRLGLVIVNTVKTAIAVADELSTHFSDYKVRIIVGRMREFEKQRGRNLILREISKNYAIGRPGQEDTPTIFVTTQTIESGVDCSGDAMITECPSAVALIQRAARCNRDGLSVSPHMVVIRHSEFVYGHSAIDRLWKALKTKAAAKVVTSDSGKRRKVRLTTRDFDDLLADSSLCPDVAEVHVVTPERLRTALCMNNVDDDWSLDGRRFLTNEARAEVTFVYRCIDAEQLSDIEKLSRIPFYLVSRPLFEEGVTVPLDEAIRWLGQRPALCFDHNQLKVITPKLIEGHDTLIVPSSYGGLDESGAWNPDSTDEVTDISVMVSLIRQGWAAVPRDTLPYTPNYFMHMAASVDGDTHTSTECDYDLPPSPEDLTADEFATALAEWYDHFGVGVSDSIRGYCAEHDGAVIVGQGRDGFTPYGFEDGDAISVKPVLLEDHNKGVGDNALSICKAMSLDEHFGAGITRAIMMGAYLGDIGKADPRNQMYFRGSTNIIGLPPIAKSLHAHMSDHVRRSIAKFPIHERHEITSITCEGTPGFEELTFGMSERSRQLVIHLMASHHGHATPSVPQSRRGGITLPSFLVPVCVGGVTTSVECTPSYSPAEQDAKAADRYFYLAEQFGFHGLALFEWIVHSADVAQSRKERCGE